MKTPKRVVIDGVEFDVAAGIAAVSRGRRPLSASQGRVLRALCKFIREFRRQPSYRELGELLGTSSVPRVIEQLEAKGWIRRSGAGSARSIEIPEDVYEDMTGAMDAPDHETASAVADPETGEER